MARPDEISSTERLLEKIRGNGEPVPVSSDDASPPPSAPEGIRPLLSKSITFGKTIHIGVDIGYSDLRLAKFDQSSGAKSELIDYRAVPFNHEIATRGGTLFPQFLKSALTEFCGSAKRTEIWSTISPSKVEARYLRIPRVPQKQIANAVYWSYKKESPIDEAKQLFDFMVLNETVDSGIRKLEVMAYAAEREEVYEIRDMFSKVGFPLTGISMAPFTFQNLIKRGWLGSEGDSVCSLFIGRTWSRIDVFARGNLVLSRDIKAGTDSMVEALQEGIETWEPQEALEVLDLDSLSTAQASLERPEISAEQADRILAVITRDKSLPQEEEKLSDLQAEMGFDITEDELLEMILPTLERMVNQLSKTLEHYALNLSDDRVGKIFVLGRLSADTRLVDYVGDRLDMPGETVDPFSPRPPSSISPVIPRAASDRSRFAPAMGLALAANATTPNFIFTYKDKNRLLLVDSINRLVFFAFLVVMCVGFAFQQWQGHQIYQEQKHVEQLRQKLYSLIPPVNRQRLQRLAMRIETRKGSLKSRSEKYLMLAIMGELSSLTPEEIRLIGLKADLPPRSKGKEQQGGAKTLILEGIVSGNRQALESILTKYTLKLKSSMIFGKPSLTERSIETFDGEEVLRFKTHLEII